MLHTVEGAKLWLSRSNMYSSHGNNLWLKRQKHTIHQLLGVHNNTQRLFDPQLLSLRSRLFPGFADLPKGHESRYLCPPQPEGL